MNKRLMIDFAAVVSALEGESFPVPASMIYLALGSNLERFETVKRALVSAGMVTATSETMLLTQKGRELASKLAKLTA